MVCVKTSIANLSRFIGKTLPRLIATSGQGYFSEAIYKISISPQKIPFEKLFYALKKTL